MTHTLHLAYWIFIKGTTEAEHLWEGDIPIINFNVPHGFHSVSHIGHREY